MGSDKTSGGQWRSRIAAFGVGALFISVGIVAMLVLGRGDANADVPDTTSDEIALPVECIVAEPANIHIAIEASGDARSLRRITIAPEVGGVVTSIHEALVVGGLIPQGDAILTIDAEPFIIGVNQAAAKVSEKTTVIERLTTEWENDVDRMTSLERREALASDQYERLRALMDEDVGTQEAIDFAEQAFVMAQDDADQLADRIALYPIQIDEACNALAMARAELDTAKLRLSKTEILAPFDARVSAYSVERGQFVQAGEMLAEFVDDAVVEIAVPLDTREARQWLRFSEAPSENTGNAWFAQVEGVECDVFWSEAPEAHAWKGRLDRVANFDEDSRTVTVVIRVDGADAAKRAGGLPLVEGMYCNVTIPGTTLQGVFAVPDTAITVDGDVYCVNDGRLETRPVEIARRSEGMAYINEGLAEGDHVIITRLINPLERTLVSTTIVPAEQP